MRKLSVLFVITVLMMSCTQTKIGYVDVQEVMKQYDAAQSIEAELKFEQENIRKSLDSVMVPFQAKVQEFYKNEAGMSASKRQVTEQELQQEQQQLQQQQQQVQQYLQQKGVAEIEALTKKIDSTVGAYAVANGYHMVMATQATGQVIYGDDSSNLSEAVIDILNAEYETSKSE